MACSAMLHSEITVQRNADACGVYFMHDAGCTGSQKGGRYAREQDQRNKTVQREGGNKAGQRKLRQNRGRIPRTTDQR